MSRRVGRFSSSRLGNSSSRVRETGSRRKRWVYRTPKTDRVSFPAGFRCPRSGRNYTGAPTSLAVYLGLATPVADSHLNDNCWRRGINCCPCNKPRVPAGSINSCHAIAEPLSRGPVSSTDDPLAGWEFFFPSFLFLIENPGTR